MFEQRGFDLASKVADAVLYEGYVLYPYRASAIKNRFRWQIGIVAPRSWAESGGEPWKMQTECLVVPGTSATVSIRVRFLQLEARLNVAGELWDEGVFRTIDIGPVPVLAQARVVRNLPFELQGERWPITGAITLAAEPAGELMKLRVRIENLSKVPAETERPIAIRHSLAGTHTLLSIEDGEFVSLMDPPAAVKAEANACANMHTWPVLVGRPGERNVMLSSPIILPDYPAVADQSPGDFFDATEIDELLTLRVMTLTEDEKREAAATDERSRQIIERSDSIPHEVFERLHGALRFLEPRNVEEFFNPPGNTPEEASILIGGRSVSKGTRVRLSPNRRSDSMDMFLAGRTAHVECVERDVEDRVYVAVTIENDPAAESNGCYHRRYYFYLDEIELLEA